MGKAPQGLFLENLVSEILKPPEKTLHRPANAPRNLRAETGACLARHLLRRREPGLQQGA